MWVASRRSGRRSGPSGIVFRLSTCLLGRLGRCRRCRPKARAARAPIAAKHHAAACRGVAIAKVPELRGVSVNVCFQFAPSLFDFSTQIDLGVCAACSKEPTCRTCLLRSPGVLRAHNKHFSALWRQACKAVWRAGPKGGCAA